MYDESESKYKKKARSRAHKLYMALGGFVTLVFLYTVAPSRRNADELSVQTTATFARPDGSKVNVRFDPVSFPQNSGDDDDQDDSGLSKGYPRYEGDQSKEEDETFSAVDVAEEALGRSQEEMDAASNQQEYDEVQDGDIFVDQEAYDNAPFIKVLPESKTRKYSMIVLAHERYYRNHPAKLYVPTLKKSSKLSVDQFKRIFMERSQPVIIPFEAMRHLGFSTKAGWTLEELKELYPNSAPMLYKYGAIVQSAIDIGPAVSSLMENRKLRKTSNGKSYPRNTKFVLKSLTKLNIQQPPFIPAETELMLPSLWFASTSEATPLHSDCCDNWAMMVAGTKKWFLAPPSEARILHPNCKGGLCWVKKLVHADKHAKTSAELRLRDRTQLVNIELPPGHILYLPAGWFHHVEQEEPTVMINFWAKGGSSFLEYYEKLQRGEVSFSSNPSDVSNDDDEVQDATSEDSRTINTDAANMIVGDTVVAGTSS